jgi:hypothetical protein
METVDLEPSEEDTSSISIAPRLLVPLYFMLRVKPCLIADRGTRLRSWSSPPRHAKESRKLPHPDPQCLPRVRKEVRGKSRSTPCLLCVRVLVVIMWHLILIEMVGNACESFTSGPGGELPDLS